MRATGTESAPSKIWHATLGQGSRRHTFTQHTFHDNGRTPGQSRNDRIGAARTTCMRGHAGRDGPGPTGPTITWMASAWSRLPDYSHGFSRGSDSSRIPVASPGLVPARFGPTICLGSGSARCRTGSSHPGKPLFFWFPLDGWSIPIWIAGFVLLVFGWPCLRWAFPSIVFLWFMVPIPFSVDRWLSVPLQRVATRLSTSLLQMLGQPAISEGNTIWLGNEALFVEEACSGMRIFVGIVALAFAFVLFTSWPWWQKAMVLLASLPVALFANSLRIVGTGLLYQFVSSDAGKRFSHDFSGLVMVPFAAALLWLFVVYLDHLFPEVEEAKPSLRSI